MAAHFAEEREQIVMDFLQKQGSIHIGDVTDMLSISPSTARLLLQKMQDKGMLKRTHGGAIPIKKEAPQGALQSGSDSGTTAGENFPFEKDSYQKDPSENGHIHEEDTHVNSRIPAPADSAPCSSDLHEHFSNITNLEKKQQIAAAAAATVHDEDFISLGSGTTTWLMAKLLHDKRDLTVVTDSIPVACELLHNDNVTLYVCGGWIMPRNGACRGITAENFFNDMKVDKAYNSADSINVEIGATSVDYDPRTERAICHSGKECYILADSSKFSKRAYMDKVLSIQEIDHVISDNCLKSSYIDALQRAGVDVIIADHP